MILLVGFRLVIPIAACVQHGDQNGARVLNVEAGTENQNLVRWIRAHGDGLTPVGYLDDDPRTLGVQLNDVPVLGGTDQTTALVQRERIIEVIFALPLRAHQSLQSIVLALQARPVRVRVVPDFFDLTFFRATIEDCDGIPLIGLRDPSIDGIDRLVKRLFNLAIASICRTGWRHVPAPAAAPAPVWFYVIVGRRGRNYDTSPPWKGTRNGISKTRPQ